MALFIDVTDQNVPNWTQCWPLYNCLSGSLTISMNQMNLGIEMSIWLKQSWKPWLWGWAFSGTTVKFLMHRKYSTGCKSLILTKRMIWSLRTSFFLVCCDGSNLWSLVSKSQDPVQGVHTNYGTLRHRWARLYVWLLTLQLPFNSLGLFVGIWSATISYLLLCM